jgi:hypothetical protein
VHSSTGRKIAHAVYDYVVVFNDYVPVVDVFQNFQPRLLTMELPEMNNNGAGTAEPFEIKFVYWSKNCLLAAA